jgi:phosphoglycerate dehydrogenase-like enzyme
MFRIPSTLCVRYFTCKLTADGPADHRDVPVGRGGRSQCVTGEYGMISTYEAVTIAVTAFVTAGVAQAGISAGELIEEAGLREGPVASKDFPGWQEPRKIVVRLPPESVAQLQSEFPALQFIVVASAAEAEREVRDADALVGFCSADVVAGASRLVWVQIFSAGAERCVGVGGIADGSIMLTNMQKMSSPTIGEHAVAMMLSLTRGLVQHAQRMGDGEWDRSLRSRIGMIALEGKTVLVAGLGGIGTAAAKRAEALGMRVIATRNSSREGPDFVDYVGLAGELLVLAAEADVVINALPLTAETEHTFDAAFFDAVKPGVFFINVGRGRTVVTDELVAALRDGRVAGAGLDVTDPEPLPPGHPLWQMQNVVITPHISSYGNDRERQYAIARENIRRFISGDALLNVVDPERGY